MSGKLPYPPPPEWGWYPQDHATAGERDSDDAVPTSVGVRAGQVTAQNRADTSVDTPDGQAHGVAILQDEDNDVDDWSQTVLSPAFGRPGTHHPVFFLHNPLTGQRIEISRGTLMGRKPSTMVPTGCTSVRLEDPTRTISRSHAGIGFDGTGQPWIEDYGSLNGTVVVVDGVETRVEVGAPVRLPSPCIVRIGDQLFEFDVSDETQE